MAMREDFTIGKLTVRAITVPEENIVNVTQITSRATGVTASGYMGAITTDTTSLAAGAEATFTVTNTKGVSAKVEGVSEKLSVGEELGLLGEGLLFVPLVSLALLKYLSYADDAYQRVETDTQEH